MGCVINKHWGTQRSYNPVFAAGDSLVCDMYFRDEGTRTNVTAMLGNPSDYNQLKSGQILLSTGGSGIAGYTQYQVNVVSLDLP